MGEMSEGLLLSAASVGRLNLGAADTVGVHGPQKITIRKGDRQEAGWCVGIWGN